MSTVTLAKIKKACRSAHWQSLHCQRLEFRVCIDDDNEVTVREEIAGSTNWYTRSKVYKVYRFYGNGLGNMDGDAVGLNWLQGEFIREQLDNDAEEIFHAWQVFSDD